MTQNLQEDYYESGRDYRSGSPHLKHHGLNRMLTGLISQEASVSLDRGLDGHVLEIGGGDGTVTEALLAQGFQVTSTDMSLPSVERMNERFRTNSSFTAIHDPSGDLSAVGPRRFSLLVFASVLHHIPDYLEAISTAIERYLETGGGFVSVQDPLFYERLPGFSRSLSSSAYITWRLTQGGTIRGIRTRLRRSSQGLSETEAADAVEYHVVREGVDEKAIEGLLRTRFRTVDVYPYWSSQGIPQQKLGERLGLVNTFAITASDLRPDSLESEQ